MSAISNRLADKFHCGVNASSGKDAISSKYISCRPSSSWIYNSKYIAKKTRSEEMGTIIIVKISKEKPVVDRIKSIVTYMHRDPSKYFDGDKPKEQYLNQWVRV